MVVYYRLCAPDGTFKVVFAGIEELASGDAEAVCTALLSRLSRDGVSLNKLMCFGSDGAAVITGKHTGVARLLRLSPFMLAIHCILHREALAVRAASDEIDYARNTFFPYMERHGRFFRDSGTRTAVFVAEQKKLNLVVLKVKVSAFTRWLSHDNTTAVIHKRFLALLNALETLSAGCAIASGLHRHLCTYAFVGWLLLSRDILPVLAGLSALWQSQELDVSALERDLPGVLKTLDDFVDHPGHNFLQLEDFIAACEAGGHVIRRESGRNETWLQKYRTRWLASLRDHLRMYFPHVPLMAAVYRLLNHRLIPPKVQNRTVQSDQFATHADSELETVIQHYCVARDGKEALINGSDLRDGWTFMKCWLQSIADEKMWEDVREPIEQKEEKNVDLNPFAAKRRKFKTTRKWRLLTVTGLLQIHT